MRIIRLADRESFPVEPATTQAAAPSPRGFSSRHWPLPLGSAYADDLLAQVRSAAMAGEFAEPSAENYVKRLPRGVVIRLPVELNVNALDYARLWIVNVLLTLLTLGLYLPWARVRTQRYFLRRTTVAGSALDYHAPPASLMTRHVLLMGLAVGVVAAWVGSAMAGLLALTTALLVAPLVVHLSLTHRMTHISWGGRRLSFEGPFEAVYGALLLPLLGVVGMACLAVGAFAFQHPLWWAGLGFVSALWLLGVPLFSWAYLRYRQHRVGLGPMRLLWKASQWSMLMLWARTAAWSVLVSVFLAGVGTVVLAAMLWAHGAPGRGALLGLTVVLSASMLVAVLPYVQARLQNLVWSKTGNRSLRFLSRLSVSGYVVLQVRHAVLLLLTLGLYWPWAVVASRRMRTQALVVWARVDPEVLKSQWPPHARTCRAVAPHPRSGG